MRRTALDKAATSDDDSTPIVNACFISYRHPGNDRAAGIVRRFKEVLESRICLCVAGARAYLDEDRLRIGDLHQEELATELCRSACMVVLFNRSYFDLTNHFCAREYRAMVDLETRRLGSAPTDLRRKGLILTVAIRDPESLPAEITAHRQYVDVSKLTLAPRYLEERAWLNRLDEIAQAVADRYVAARDRFSTDNCGDFRLPAFDTIQPWLRRTVAAHHPAAMPGH